MKGAWFGMFLPLYLLPSLLLPSDVVSSSIANNRSKRALRKGKKKNGKKGIAVTVDPTPEPSVPPFTLTDDTMEPATIQSRTNIPSSEPVAYPSPFYFDNTTEPSGKPTEAPSSSATSHFDVTESPTRIPTTSPSPRPSLSDEWISLSPTAKTTQATLSRKTFAPSFIPSQTPIESFTGSEAPANDLVPFTSRDEAITFTCNNRNAHAGESSEGWTFNPVVFYYKIEANASADMNYIIALVGTAVAEAVAVEFLACGRSLRILQGPNNRKLSLVAIDALPADNISSADECYPQKQSSTCAIVLGAFTIVSNDDNVNTAGIIGFVEEIMNAGIFVDSREEVDVSYIGPFPVAHTAVFQSEEKSQEDMHTEAVGRNSIRAGYAMSILSAFAGSLLLGLVVYRCHRPSHQHQHKENLFDEETWLAHPSPQQQERRCAHIKEQDDDSSHLKRGGLFFCMFGSVKSDESIESMSEMGGSSILGGLTSYAPGPLQRMQQAPQIPEDNMPECGIDGQEHYRAEENTMQNKWLRGTGTYT